MALASVGVNTPARMPPRMMIGVCSGATARFLHTSRKSWPDTPGGTASG